MPHTSQVKEGPLAPALVLLRHELWTLGRWTLDFAFTTSDTRLSYAKTIYFEIS